MGRGRGGITVVAVAAALLIGWGAADVAHAQGAGGAAETIRSQPVVLVADAVAFDETTQTVTATGNVEVYQGTRVLTASTISYGSRTGQITAQGPLVLRDGSGSVILADAATLDAELRDGIVTGARAILGQNEGTLAAVEGQRIDGRYSLLSRVVYSSCEVCLGAPTPFWQIRARRVVHDDVERMVHYEGAVFDLMGVPVAYLPFFSHPDPTVERRSGLLEPTFRQSSVYGFGVQAPYFIDLGPSRDATITPFPTSRDGLVLMGEYRQAFDTGALRLNGSAAAVQTGPEEALQGRGHLFGGGTFDVSDSAGRFLGLGDGTQAGFDLQLVSDDTYLDRYDFSDIDRLESVAFLNRYAPDGFLRADSTYFRSLREGETDDRQMIALPYIEARHVMPMGDLGEIGYSGGGVMLSRPDGRDTGRLSLGADWRADTVLPIGLAVTGFAEARLDAYAVWSDPTDGDTAAMRVFPQIGAEVRYPLVATFLGTRHLLEPGVQLVVAPNSDGSDRIPDEDSAVVEFNAANVFSRNRFPGYDRVETGTRLNVGIGYTRVADDPLTLSANIGQVFRLSDQSAFQPGSGLTDRTSDTVAAVDIGYGPFLTFSNSFRFDTDFRLRRSEIGSTLNLDRVQLAASYVFLDEAATAGITRDREELNTGLSLTLSRNWSIGGSWRQDLERAETVEIGGSLAYRNECSAIALSVMQDYPNRTDGDRELTFGLRVQIFGQADPRQRGRAACSGAERRAN